jgi:uncharacterized membrane protein
MNNKNTILLQFLVATIPIAIFFIIKDKLPELIPLHFNEEMIADRMGNKAQFLNSILIFAGISIISSILMLNIGKFDPKKRLGEENSVVKKLSWAITIFMAFFAVASQYIVFKYKDGVNNEANVKLIPIAVSILLIVIGNLLNSIKSNYFIGFRTPWALENEENWRKTNALGSKIMFSAGILMLVLILMLPAKNASAIILPIVLFSAFAPFVYSYVLYKKMSNIQ